MGISPKPRSIRWDEGTERQLSEIRDAFSPFCNSRSATLRVVIDLFHKIVFTPGIVEKLGVLLQGLPCAYFVRQVPGESGPAKPGPVRMAQQGELAQADRSRRTGTDSATYRLAKAVAVAIPVSHRGPWGLTPFRQLGKRVA